MLFETLEIGDRLSINSSEHPDAKNIPRNFIDNKIEFTIADIKDKKVAIQVSNAPGLTLAIKKSAPVSRVNHLDPFSVLSDSLCHPHDKETLKDFLNLHRNKYSTYRNYKREIERFLLWVKYKVNNARLSELKREDFLHYRAFLQDPDSSWCGKKVLKKTSDGSPNPHWRPFIGPMRPGSINLAFDVLDSFFSWQVYEGRLPHNAIPVSRQKISRSAPSGTKKPSAQIRIISEHDLRMVRNAVEIYPRKTMKEKLVYERTRYLIAILYYLALPLTEIVKASMGNFKCENGNWFFISNTEDVDNLCVSVNSYMLDALKRYRKFLNLEELPEVGEKTPLFPRDDLVDSFTDRHIYTFIKQAFLQAADLVASTSPDQADRLRRASPQWIKNNSLSNFKKTQEFLRSPTHNPLIKLY